MFILILLVILGLIVVGSVLALFFVEGKVIAAAVGGVALVIAAFVGFFGSSYTQDTGDASVLIDWTGNIVGQETSPGLHFKAPWVTNQTFNVRNQQVTFVGDGSQDHATGTTPTGPQITVQDADGVSSNIDVALRYSIRPDQVTTIYRQFRTEDNFKSSFIQQDVRAAIRNVPGSFHTLALLTKRGDVENAVRLAVENRWKGTAVTVDSLSLQEIRVPESVKDRYNEAQQAAINVSTEQAKLNAARVHAQQQIVQSKANGEAQVAAAQGAAKANAILEKSLTDRVLRQHTLDSLKSFAANGGTIVLDSGNSTLLQVGSK